ncbi:MAG TPA: GntR family transcriptional regulator [bacterium]|nr:GntR family transcriptional regulator [bacterium]
MRQSPRYLAITEALRATVMAAAPNTILPTEEEFAQHFGVSRPTVRRALGFLERSGYVSRQRGRGTIVSPTKLTRSLAPLYTLEEDFRQQGIPLETRVLRYERAIEPPADIRERLKLGARGQVAVLELLRLVGGRVIACDRAYIPTALVARFQPEKVTETPLLEVLREQTGIRIGRLDWEIEILPAAPDVAGALGMTPGVLVVASRTTAYADGGSAVSRSERCYRIDRVKFHFATGYAPDAAPAEGGRPAQQGSGPDRTPRVRRPAARGRRGARSAGGRPTTSGGAAGDE